MYTVHQSQRNFSGLGPRDKTKPYHQLRKTGVTGQRVAAKRYSPKRIEKWVFTDTTRDSVHAILTVRPNEGGESKTI